MRLGQSRSSSLDRKRGFSESPGASIRTCVCECVYVCLLVHTFTHKNVQVEACSHMYKRGHSYKSTPATKRVYIYRGW